MRKNTLKKLTADEKGQVLIIVMLLMLVSVLIVAPMLSYVSSGLLTGKNVYESKMHEFYAADAGVEHALWYLQSKARMEQLDPDWEQDDYEWTKTYQLTDPTDPDDEINNKDVLVTIAYEWLLYGIHDPIPDANDHWTVIGAINYEATNNYIVDITTDESSETLVDCMGVWLPQGYSYVDDSVKINGVAIGGDSLVDDPDEQPHRSGTALIWDLPGDTFFQNLSEVAPPPEGHPPAAKFPPSVRLSFDYTITPFKEAKGFFPWIELVDGRIAWDIEAGVYYIESQGITSDEKSTTVESYVPRGVMRYTSGSGGTSSAIKGDHIVIGNTLMTCCWGEECLCNCGSQDSRNYAPVPVEFPIEDYPDAERESSAQVNAGGVDAVPSDAKIERAYLYWTAWLRGDDVWKEGEPPEELGSWVWDDCMDSNANPNRWEACVAADPVVQEVDDWLGLNAYDGSAYLQVGTTKVTPENAGDPAGTVVASKYYISEGSSDVQPSYQYACFADVTDQVTAIRTAALGATFTVAGVHAHPAESCSSGNTWNNSANAGWSMIIIYSSEDKETHQIYLYAGCDHLWNDAREFTIAGFETPSDLEPGETNEAKITVFASEGDEFGDEYLKFKGENTGDYSLYDVSNTTAVFNSRSDTSEFTPLPEDIPGQPEGQISGVDIDTYTRTRPSGGTLLSDIVWPGDTSAKINVGSSGDGFMLIYVVFSVRSTKVPAGEEFEVGTMTYEIK